MKEIKIHDNKMKYTEYSCNSNPQILYQDIMKLKTNH